ncbi:MAG: metalloregulator ArsR/SmtB family transcription factor [Proteobacteria bacterium]|nr:metalloregulator ArsR/SmtB family transcription factor [Pseudomonadota bacterium]
MSQADPLSATFAALSDPTRRAILARLAQGPATVGELAAPFAISAPAISRHLKVLEHAKLIQRIKEAQWRRCKLEPARLHQAAEWMDQYRQFWEAQFDSLAQFIDTLKETDRPPLGSPV